MFVCILVYVRIPCTLPVACDLRSNVTRNPCVHPAFSGKAEIYIEVIFQPFRFRFNFRTLGYFVFRHISAQYPWCWASLILFSVYWRYVLLQELTNFVVVN